MGTGELCLVLLVIASPYAIEMRIEFRGSYRGIYGKLLCSPANALKLPLVVLEFQGKDSSMIPRPSLSEAIVAALDRSRVVALLGPHSG
jgi:hypothetical protein